MRRLCTSTAAPTALARLLGNFEVRTAAQSYRTTITPDWMQGQTTYGGLSAALCLEGARRALSGDGAVELPPLRSALICFVGAAGGPVAVACAPCYDTHRLQRRDPRGHASTPNGDAGGHRARDVAVGRVQSATLCDTTRQPAHAQAVEFM